MTPDDWWRGAVLYQIYPRSFSDSNGDGVGDLPGIAARLGHVARLGVDGVWIAPFFPSPMKDFGYDVSDFRGVDPMFGTLDDFDRLIAEAHRLGLKVLIDQVWSHSSDRHPWFLESCADRQGPRADWYVWADSRPDGGPPNNWQSVFGGPAWSWDPRRRQYYLHHFLSSQPKLNLRHEGVVAALLDAAEFWLRRGVDGFRLDAVDFMLHDPALTDNPPRPPPGGVTPVKPFALQHHAHDLAHPDTTAVMGRLRALLDRWPGRAALAEVSSEPGAFGRCDHYSGGAGGRLHMAYTLGLTRRRFHAADLRATIAEIESHFTDGWLCWAFSNHDVERVASRWGDGSPEAAKLLMALLLCQRGSVCVYQGEELGLGEAEIPEDRLRDPYGIAFWPQFKGRDGCRTPMPWRATAPHAGFSTAEPWLPLPDEHRALAVDRQEADPNSTLHAWRRFLAWRKTRPALARGAATLVEAPGDVLAVARCLGDETILCLFNLGEGPAIVPVPKGGRPIDGHGFHWETDATGVRLPRWGAAFLSL
ncbi:MAG: DUF3459 domain-containing protein [Alphaproteobacteria bacterium]|nr:DUF3459 domain-containing protein [Alphaproteobacteria bacterium]